MDGRLRRRVIGQFADFGLLQVAGQPIRTEHQSVARLERLLEQVDLNLLSLSERPGDDVATRMVASIRRLEQPARDLLGDPGVVLGELGQAAVFDQVSATVADVRQEARPPWTSTANTVVITGRDCPWRT